LFFVPVIPNNKFKFLLLFLLHTGHLVCGFSFPLLFLVANKYNLIFVYPWVNLVFTFRNTSQQ
jgi:hypothetical protein